MAFTDIHGLKWSPIGSYEVLTLIEQCTWLEIRADEDKPDTRGTTKYAGCKFYKEIVGECHYCGNTVYKVVALQRRKERLFRNTVEIAYLRPHIQKRLKTNDHVVPASVATNHPKTFDGKSNIVDACYQCNQSKAAKSYEEFMEEMAAIKRAQGLPSFSYNFLSSFHPTDPMEPVKITVCHDRGSFDMHLTRKEFKQLYGMCHGIAEFYKQHEQKNGPPDDLG